MTEYICDFCEITAPFLFPLNDGMWAICRDCYDHIYDEARGEEE